MKKISKKSRRFWYWLIPILAGVIIAFLKVFHKPASYQTNHVVTKTNNINFPKTENKNKGDVVYRDKIVNNYHVPEKEAVKPPKKSHATTEQLPAIINKGNLSVGQQGGTVNQYTVPELPDRQLNDADKESIKSLIKPGYNIEFTVITSNSEEAQTYGLQLLGYLQHNYNVTNSTLIGMSSENKRSGHKRFYADVDDGQKLVKILVQSQN